MKRLTLVLPDELVDDLKEVARRRKRRVSTLVRRAIERVYEDDLDALLGERAVDEYLADPSSFISLEEYRRQRGVTTPATEGEHA